MRIICSRRGYTLIEILVVCVLIALLTGLLIPAAQSAREAARHAQCGSNLRQIGTAMNMYHGLHNMYTPAYLLTGRNWSSNYLSPHVFLLPFIDQPSLYNAVNMDIAQTDNASAPSHENRTARLTTLAVYLCPSDSNSSRNAYRFNKGRLGGQGPKTGFDGPFNIKVLPSQASVTDGVSRTAFVSERVSGTFIANTIDGVRNIKHPTVWSHVFYTDSAFIDYCLKTQADSWTTNAGKYWMYTSLSHTLYSHNGLPNDRRPSCTSTIAADNGFGLNPPRSYHPAAVNVLFGDGHIEKISNTINQLVWTSLGTHAAGD